MGFIYISRKGQRSTKDETNNNKQRTLDATPGVCTDKPSAPEGPLEVSDIWAEQVKLSWKPPKDNGGGEITGNSTSTRKQTLTEVEVLDVNSSPGHVNCLVSGCLIGSMRVQTLGRGGASGHYL